ncbi:hypothetical protein [Amycolatopsis sp. NBC_01480]|uniref:hypothetical protein n=1 Tax=Amycolatopsis sp. NBC_01480 TaxID=2903562 RepID=UPI002E27EDBB|nr:hypothetical protein [Amycolatopsis sp. NBC_01480]
MVAQPPVERPDSTDFLVNKINDLQRQITELAASTKYPFVISHGSGVKDFQIVPDLNDPNGNPQIVIGNGAGQPFLNTFYSRVYGGKAVRMYDLAGNPVWNQDELCGYGLSAPQMSMVMGADFYGLNRNNVPTSESVIGIGLNVLYNPAIRFSSLVSPNTNSGTWSYRYKVDYPGGSVYSTLRTGLTASQYIVETVLLPEVAMATEVTMTLLATPTVSQPCSFASQLCHGVAASNYYIDNGLPFPS